MTTREATGLLPRADAAEGAGTGGGKTVTDPHAFQSIANARIYVNNIAEAFCAADSEGCVSYQTNAAAYIKKLDALEALLRHPDKE